MKKIFFVFSLLMLQTGGSSPDPSFGSGSGSGSGSGADDDGSTSTTATPATTDTTTTTTTQSTSTTITTIANCPPDRWTCPGATPKPCVVASDQLCQFGHGTKTRICYNSPEKVWGCPVSAKLPLALTNDSGVRLEDRKAWCSKSFDPRRNPWTLTYSLRGGVIIAAYIKDTTEGAINWFWFTVRTDEENTPIPYNERTLTISAGPVGSVDSSYIPICKPQHEYEFTVAVWAVDSGATTMLERLMLLPKSIVTVDTLISSAGQPSKLASYKIPRMEEPVSSSPETSTSAPNAAGEGGDGTKTTKAAPQTTAPTKKTTKPLPCKRGFLTCNGNGECVYGGQNCDGIKDCSDGSDEAAEWCCGGGGGTGFLCRDAQETCIPMVDQCDGVKDCAGGEDEAPQLCKTTVTTSTATTFLVPCSQPTYFKCTPDCNDASDFKCCIEEERLCDGSRDCSNGNDEFACSSTSTTTTSSLASVRTTATSTAAVAGGGSRGNSTNNGTIPDGPQSSTVVAPVVVCVVLLAGAGAAWFYWRRRSSAGKDQTAYKAFKTKDESGGGDDDVLITSNPMFTGSNTVSEDSAA